MKKVLGLLGLIGSESTVIPSDAIREEEVAPPQVTHKPENLEEDFVLTQEERLRNPYHYKKLHPVLTWEDFGPSIFPATVDANMHYRLSAKDYRGRDVTGHYFYTIEPGEVLEAGFHELSVTFVPDKTFKYANVTISKDLEVKRRRPIVHWNPPVQERCFLYRKPLITEIFEGVTVPELDGGDFVFSHEPGVILEIGTHKITVEYTPSALHKKNYTRGYASLQIEIAGAPVPLEWHIPGADQPVSPFKGKRRKSEIGAVGKDILYKDPLPEWLFCPRSLFEDAHGTWVFRPPPGSILPAGWNDLHATLIPHDQTRFKISSISQRVFIHKLRTELSWPTPSPIPDGELLDSYTLRATNVDNLPGKFVYEPDFGTGLPQGIHTLWVHFTPDDTSYEECSLSVTMKILPKRQLRILWLEPEEITYPTPLSRYQLNAMLVGAGSNATGEFVYDPPLDTVLDAGMHTLRVAFHPEKPSIAVAHASVTLKVLPTVARLVWNQPDSILEGEGLYDTTLNCYATNVPPGEGDFIYNPPAGTVLHGGEHRLHCLFRPHNTNNFIENRITVKLLVRQRPRFMPRLTWPDPVPESPLIYGSGLGVMQLNAQCVNAVGSYTYDPPLETVLPVGRHELVALFHPFDPSKVIEGITVTSHVTIVPRRPHFVWQPPIDLIYGTILSHEDHCNATATFAEGDINAVPGTFIYQPPPGTLLETGEYTFTCTFTPDDTLNFHVVTAAVQIFVHRALPLIQWMTPTRPLVVPVQWGHDAFPKPRHHGTTGNADTDIAGEWVYDFDRYHVWDEPGRYTLSVRYAPEDIINYLSGTATITLEVIDARDLPAWLAAAEAKAAAEAAATAAAAAAEAEAAAATVGATTTTAATVTVAAATVAADGTSPSRPHRPPSAFQSPRDTARGGSSSSRSRPMSSSGTAARTSRPSSSRDGSDRRPTTPARTAESLDDDGSEVAPLDDDHDDHEPASRAQTPKTPATQLRVYAMKYSLASPSPWAHRRTKTGDGDDEEEDDDLAYAMSPYRKLFSREATRSSRDTATAAVRRSCWDGDTDSHVDGTDDDETSTVDKNPPDPQESQDPQGPPL